MLDSILESVRVIALPTKTDFRSVQVREVALFEGPSGWGEFSPFLEYGPRECVPWLVSAVESALVPAPQRLRQKIGINATLPAINGEEEIAEILSWFQGCLSVKIKVGRDLHEDLARIAHVRKLLPSAKIRIDVNGSWSLEDAVESINSIYENGELEYVEQPCNSLDELRELKTRLQVPVLIAGDEIIRKSDNPMGIDLSEAVDILMLKVAPLGGVKRSMEIAEFHGLPVVVSSALESAVGISHGLDLAAALPNLSYACGLGTGQLLQNDVGAYPIIDGTITVKSVAPDMEAIQKNLVSPGRLDWWRARIRETWNAGAMEWVVEEGWVW